MRILIGTAISYVDILTELELFNGFKDEKQVAKFLIDYEICMAEVWHISEANSSWFSFFQDIGSL